MNLDNTNPYVGLRPFDMDESILFFGRNEQTTELLQRLHQHHFVAVVGSSGSGKSSLLRAGLIPALKAGFLVDDSDHWFIAIMKPGKSPLLNLAEAILVQLNTEVHVEDISELAKQIKEEGADVILNLLAPVRKEKNTNFFLLVDQFEELFRFAMEHGDVEKKDEAIDFVNIMLELAQQITLPFYAVLTMRTDFIGDCVQFNGLPEAMNQSQYLVPRMNRVQLKMVIEGPAKLYGGKLDASLTSKLLNELGKVKDELPLLQHALMRMWEFETNVNKSGTIDLEDYQSIGGIEKALSNHADEALVGITDEEKRIAKELFQALTAIDENGRKIRRPVLLSQLKELTGASEEQLLHTIDLFIKGRRSFLIINNAIDTDDKVIDISHESLIRQWNTLSAWVDEEGESASVYLQLSEATKLNKRKKKDFLTGSELQIALEWRDKFKPSAIWANRYKEGFEDCMVYLDASEKDWLIKEKQAKGAKQKRRTLIIAIVLLLFIVIGAIVFTKFAMDQRNIAEVSKAAALEQKASAEMSRSFALAQKDSADMSRSFALEQMRRALMSDISARMDASKARRSDSLAQIETLKAKKSDSLAQIETLKAKMSDSLSNVKAIDAINKLAVAGSAYLQIQAIYNSIGDIIDSTSDNSETKKKLIELQKNFQKSRSLNFDGTDDYVSLGDFNLGISDFTIETWLKPTTSQSAYLISNRTNEGDQGGNWFNIVWGDSKIMVEIAMCDNNSSYVEFRSKNSLPLDIWSHIAVVREGTSIKIYINGFLDEQFIDKNKRNITTKNNVVNIGGWPRYNRAFYNGDLDELRIWNKARSIEEINDNMAKDLTPQNFLIVYFKFDMGVASGKNSNITTLPDLSGNSFHGTLKNFKLDGEKSNWVEGYESNKTVEVLNPKK